MRITTLACLTLLLAAAPAAADHATKTLAQDFPAAGADAVSIDFPVGELRVETIPGDSVRVDLRVECDRWFRSCAGRIEDVVLSSSLEGNSLHVAVRGYGHGTGDLEVRGTIGIPAGRDLAVDMGVGELRIEGVTERMDIDLGVGEVDVRMPASAVRSVSLDTGVGDTSLRLPAGRVGETRSFVSSEIDWREGSGEAPVHVEVGVGDARVRLD